MNSATLKELLNTGIEKSAVPLAMHTRMINALNDHLKRQHSIITAQQQEIQRRKLERGLQGMPGEQGKQGKQGIRGVVGKQGKSIVGDKGDTVISKETIIKEIDKTVPTKKLVDAVIEKIKKDKPIDVSHIRNFQSFVMGKTKYNVEELMHGGGGITDSSIILPMSGVIDNTNKTFTFVRKPIMVVVNGATYRNGAGVTITNTTAVLDAPVGTGGDIYALG